MSHVFERSMPNKQRRVVVTGLGAVTPLGLNVKTSWENALNGISGINKITLFDPSSLNVQIAGEVSGFNPDEYIPKKEQKKMSRFIHLSLAATQMALEDSGVEFTDALKTRTGVIIGVGMGGLPDTQETASLIKNRGPSRVSPFYIPKIIANLASGQISIKYGLMGPNYTVTSACASGSHSLGDAAQFIRNGHCDVMVAGGAESTICSLAMAGFQNMKALSTRNNDPHLASRPWDKDRDGFVLSEGAATLILEDFEHAKKRGATIYAELSGYGLSSDAYHVTSPPEDGAGAKLAMKMCLDDAGLNPEDIDYVNAHGTSTPTGDTIEARSIEATLGVHNNKLLVSSTKSMTGHTLGAAGAIESVFSIMSLYTNKVPPTINLEHLDGSFKLDFVPNVAKEAPIKHALNNSFGFGGTNACLIFSKI